MYSCPWVTAVGNSTIAGAGDLPGVGVSAPALKALAEVFRGLGDRSRLHILMLLARRGEMNVTALGEALDQSQPAVSHHLNQLKKAGLIDFRRDGKFNFYRLAPDGLGPLVALLFPDPEAPPRLSLGGIEVVFNRPGERGA